jgi:predicted nuclease of predicted toxin-antitoxin system
MILADENISHRIIEALRNKGYEVYSIFEQNRGKTDINIASFSLNPPRIILTEDKDFGELVYLHLVKVTGVIFIRVDWKETMLMAEKLISFLENETLTSLTNKFVTITPDKLRINKILDE